MDSTKRERKLMFDLKPCVFLYFYICINKGFAARFVITIGAFGITIESVKSEKSMIFKSP